MPIALMYMCADNSLKWAIVPGNSTKALEAPGSPSALSREQGAIIYTQIMQILNSGNKVILDFQDIESLITPFLNVSIGKLYETFSSSQLNTQLEIKNPPDGTNSKFKIQNGYSKRKAILF